MIRSFFKSISIRCGCCCCCNYGSMKIGREPAHFYKFEFVWMNKYLNGKQPACAFMVFLLFQWIYVTRYRFLHCSFKRLKYVVFVFHSCFSHRKAAQKQTYETPFSIFSIDSFLSSPKKFWLIYFANYRIMHRITIEINTLFCFST